jgi:hypothetical protein
MGSRRIVTHLALLGALGALGCDDEPKRTPAATAAATAEPATAPTPSKPTLPPTIVLDKSGALVAGARVTLEIAGAAERLKSELSQHRSFLEKQVVRVAAERKVKPAYVATMLAALGASGANRVLVRTSTRSDYPTEVGFLPPDKAKAAPRCSVIGMILADRSTAVWQLSGGVAGRRGKGMAGPDLTLTGESIRTKAKSCEESTTLFVAGAEGVEWGLVYDLAASSKTFGTLFFAEAALVSTPPVPGHPVELDP